MANHLFIIGIDDYLGQNKLKSCVKDCRDLKAVFVEKYDFKEKDVVELYDSSATNKSIQDAFKKYIGKLSTGDNLIIVFSGHGYYDDKMDEGYWVPYEGLDYTSYISNETVLSYLNRMQAKHIAIISDSCFSNSLLLTNPTKSNHYYAEKSSRWALTSAFDEAMDSDGESNTFFAESLIEFLNEKTEDFRFSELAEHVKKSFEYNILQKPQFAPLQVKGHKGGEFVFKIKNQIDRRQLKGYIGAANILRLYKRNTEFIQVAEFENKTDKIGYKLFLEVDSVIKKKTFYLFLYEGIIQTRTLQHLKENHTDAFKEKNLVLLIPKERNKANIESRKKNMVDKFKPISAFYIDEFIKEQCTPPIFQDQHSKFLNLSNFVLPQAEINDEFENIREFSVNWLNQENEPILVLKGDGGIGKTTFSKYIADISYSLNSKASVLFIDSLLIKDVLIKNLKWGDLGLYDFYEALHEISNSGSDKLSEELFRLNIDAGNLIVIIDGLDEIISKLHNFNVEKFLSTIKEYSQEIRGGKVIITCRSYFWNKNEFGDHNYQLIEISPFTADQAEEFFMRSFNNDSRKVRKGIELANEFSSDNGKPAKKHHPYVLDLIRSIIENDKESIQVDLNSSSSVLLSPDNKHDYIIYKVCEREIKRVGQIDVDNQVKFFVRFAVYNNSFVSESQLGDIVKRSVGEDVGDTRIEAFKSHPFLKVIDGNKFTFRYDFLSDVFTSIFASSIINAKKLDKDEKFKFEEVIREHCAYGAPLSNEIVCRVLEWGLDELVFFEDVINQHFETSKKGELDIFVASLFSLGLMIAHRHKDNSTEINTELLKLLFEKDNVIKGASIQFLNSEQKIKFDFTDQTVKDSYIDNYNSFWECSFSETTKFYKCHLTNLKIYSSRLGIKADQFIDCVYDSDIKNILEQGDKKKENKQLRTKQFLNGFFHLFFSNGRLGRQWEDKVIKPRYAGVNKINYEYNKLIKHLKKSEFLLISEEQKKRKFSVTQKRAEEVEKFIKDGTISKDIAKLINSLS